MIILLMVVMIIIVFTYYLVQSKRELDKVRDDLYRVNNYMYQLKKELKEALRNNTLLQTKLDAISEKQTVKLKRRSKKDE